MNKNNTVELDKVRRENEELNRSEFFANKTILESKPVALSIGLTLKCNLKCVMCFTLFEEKYDIDENILANKLEPLLSTAIVLRWSHAGDLFATPRSKEYLKLINMIKAPHGYVSTNLFGAGKHIPAIMEGGITNMSVSLDACTKDVYEKIRVGSRWEKVVENFDKINEMKEKLNTPLPHFRLIFVVMRQNIHQMEDFVRFAKEKKAISVDFLRLLPTPTSLQVTEAIPLEEERASFLKAVKLGKELDISVRHTFINDVAYESPSEINSMEYQLEKFCEIHQSNSAAPFCSVPWRQMVITTSGKVQVCCFSWEEIGDLKHQTVDEVWNGKKMRTFRQKIIRQDLCQCKRCPMVGNKWKTKTIVDTGIKPSIDSSMNMLERMGNLNMDCCDREGEPITEFKLNMVMVKPEFLRFLSTKKDIIPPKKDNNKTYHKDMVKYFSKKAIKKILNHTIMWPSLMKLEGLFDITLKRQIDFNNTSRRLNQQIFAEIKSLITNNDRQKAEFESLKETSRQLMKALADIMEERNPQGKSFAKPHKSIDDVFYSVYFEKCEMPEDIKAGQTYEIPITFFNNSLSKWESNGIYPVNLSYQILDDGKTVIERDGLRTSIGEILIPLETRELKAQFKAPEIQGEYVLRWELVHEGKTWFSERGAEVLDVKIEVIQ